MSWLNSYVWGMVLENNLTFRVIFWHFFNCPISSIQNVYILFQDFKTFTAFVLSRFCAENRSAEKKMNSQRPMRKFRQKIVNTYIFTSQAYELTSNPLITYQITHRWELFFSFRKQHWGIILKKKEKIGFFPYEIFFTVLLKEILNKLSGSNKQIKNKIFHT